MTDRKPKRRRMIESHLAGRGITDARVLDAFGRVRREDFVAEELLDLAYEDAPLPIDEGQTISQPYVVALTAEALEFQGDERVLEVGTGSGYAAAIFSKLAREVFTVERFPSLADTARERLARLGYTNVHVACRDGSLGWPEHAPFDAIAVAAGGPTVPKALLEQLSIGGRLIIPVGPDESAQVLMRVTRTGADTYRQESLGDVRFVPLVGVQGWDGIARLVREEAQPIADIDTDAIDALVDRVGRAKLVLLGEATHGTHEFYRMRARITRELVQRKGFRFVAVEADWPDAARIDDYVRGDERRSRMEFTPFSRFPTWMWRNEEVDVFVAWLRAYNADHRRAPVGFHGLDLYSLFTSIGAVLAYLDDVDPDAARLARFRYGTLTPWQDDPASYGAAVLAGRYESSEDAVVAMLRDMLERRLDYARRDGDRFFDAAQNAKLVADAESYYRTMYYGSATSWNLRDAHMFETLRALSAFHGPEAKGVVWAHNSHVGDAAATEMGTQGELNVGQLCRNAFGDDVFIVGFGTDHGTVAAASNWDEPMERMKIRPAHAESYERVCHDADVPAFLLHLRDPRRDELREELSRARLERAIGVVYRAETELQSHYFMARLPVQFDEYVWFDETHAIRPLHERVFRPSPGLPDTYPFGV